MPLILDDKMLLKVLLHGWYGPRVRNVFLNAINVTLYLIIYEYMNSIVSSNTVSEMFCESTNIPGCIYGQCESKGIDFDVMTDNQY